MRITLRYVFMFRYVCTRMHVYDRDNTIIDITRFCVWSWSHTHKIYFINLKKTIKELTESFERAVGKHEIARSLKSCNCDDFSWPETLPWADTPAVKSGSAVSLVIWGQVDHRPFRKKKKRLMWIYPILQFLFFFSYFPVIFSINYFLCCWKNKSLYSKLLFVLDS